MNLLPPDFGFFYADTAALKPALAISACLNGEAVRYDGKTKRLGQQAFFQQHFRLIPVCPEVGAGLGIPRPPIQLVATDDGVRALGRDDATLDVTDALTRFRQSTLKTLAAENICAYLFKSRSPSCGLNSTPVFNRQRQQIDTRSGLQASYFQQQMPWLVFRQETQLQTPQQCESMLRLCRLSSECQQAIVRNELAGFHLHYRALWHRQPRLASTLDPAMPSRQYRVGLLALLEAT